MAGAYIVTRLIFDSVEERLDNQLLAASKVTADAILTQEDERLIVLRQVSKTIGMPQALKAKNYAEIEAIIMPIAANNPKIDSFILLDDQGAEIFNLRRSLGGDKTLADPKLDTGASFVNWPIVEKILKRDFDDYGDKFTVLAKDPEQDTVLMYTAGPLWLDDQLIGVVLIGQYLQNTLQEMKLKAQAEITLYQSTGDVIGTTFASGQEDIKALLRSSATLYDKILQDPDTVQKGTVRILGQDYQLAFAPLNLRGEPTGSYSVGLPSEFVVKAGENGRNIFALLVFLAIVILLIIGFIVTQQILKPIAKLVSATAAIADGNLDLRTNISSRDEIGRLATSFDHMTDELKQRTEELEEESSKIKAILSSIADGVIVLDKKREITQENPAAEKILSNLKNAALQKAPSDEDTDDKQPGLDSVAAFLQDIGFDEATRFTLSDHSYSALAAPVITQDQQISGSVVVLRDITLEVESEQLKNKFIESISHELLTPLVPIKGYMDLLLMTSAGQLNEQQLGFIKKSAQNLDDLHNLISTLIDVTQIETGALGLDIEEFNFTDLVKEAAEYWKPLMADRKMNFSVHIQAANLPVNGDMKRLKRVLSYLLDNASIYNRPGGAVDLYLKQENHHARVDVVDTGVGIAQEAHKHIFTRFMRALHEDFYETRGAGLGLYMSKGIITQHGGDIGFKSTVNQGSTFYFVIPLTSDEQPQSVTSDE